MPKNAGVDVLASILSEVRDVLEGMSGRFEWAEDEIRRASARHPSEADTLWHAHGLLKPTHPRMDYERVFRAHCRELLDRVASGGDTRTGTAAEVSCLASDASAASPLNTTGAGLYFRMFAQAFPDLEVAEEAHREHYEALRGSQIDDLEAESRLKLAVHDRVLGEITCMGKHNGVSVPCKYIG